MWHTVKSWIPVWSRPAALRTLRAVLVVPVLFALTYKVIGDAQMATFATFGGFATLVMASFAGSVRDKAIAHLGLGLAATVLIVIGTAVNGTAWIAALVTLPVAFAVLFAGLAGPNAAAGVTAAMLAYVLPAASPGSMHMIGSRLAGWWLATVAGTIVVLLLNTRPAADRVRVCAAACARALGEQLDAAVRGEPSADLRAASMAAKHELLSAFTATPYRPTGLATTDQALDSVVALLEWCASVISDSLVEYRDLCTAPEVERELLAATAANLRDVAAVLAGDAAVAPDLPRLERGLTESVRFLQQMSADDAGFGDAVHLSFHARTAAVATLRAADDAMIATRRAAVSTIDARRMHWWGLPEDGSAVAHRRAVFGIGNIALRHASLGSVWFLNSVRGAVALAAAVAVADLTGVQHGFWVVLGTLSVLRTTASATGSTALRALLGVTLGFVVGALVILAIGTSTPALWTALVVSMVVASYAPGTAPFAIGQAAFTVTISVLYNLLAPVGWKIGMLRIEDVAIGCAVSLVVGLLFWPRGASEVVGDDLAAAFRSGSGYLRQSVGWSLGLHHDVPRPAAAVTAGLRLDEALRGFLAEQGAKRVPAEDLWRLVGATLRLRLTGYSLAGLPSPRPEDDPARDELLSQADQLVDWFDHLASRLEQANGRDPEPPALPSIAPIRWDAANPPPGLSCALWVDYHLQHVTPHLAELIGPAEKVAAQRHRPWWR